MTQLRRTPNVSPVGTEHNSATDADLICWNYTPLGLSNQTVLPTAGVIYLSRLPWRKTGPLAKICYAVNTLASGLTANQNYVGAYDSAGTRIGTTAAGAADTDWTSTGWKESTLSGGPFTVAGSQSGWVWVAWLGNGTTRPAIGKAAGTASSFAANLGVGAASSFHGHILTAQTALPASITPASITPNANNFWCGAKAA